MNSLEKVIQTFGKKLNGKISTPIVVGGWAINLLGFPRNTLDFDFMILEDEFKTVASILNSIGYKQVVKTSLYARFDSESDIGMPYLDCLFANKSTYGKIVSAGQKIDIFGTEFILPDLLHVIAMKLHAVKHGEQRRFAKDFDDIVSLIEINDLDISSGSKFSILCERYADKETYLRIQDAVPKR